MFGIFQDKQAVVIEAIHAVIKKEQSLVKILLEDLAEEIVNGEVLDPNLYYLTSYISEKHASATVENISSRTMFQALHSLNSSAEYDVDKDHAFGSLGNYEVSINRYKDGRGTFIIIGVKGTYKYITAKITNLVSITPLKTSDNKELEKQSMGTSSGMTLAHIEALAKIVADQKNSNSENEWIDFQNTSDVDIDVENVFGMYDSEGNPL